MLQQLGHLCNMLTHHGRLPLKGGGTNSVLIEYALQEKKIILNEAHLLTYRKKSQAFTMVDLGEDLCINRTRTALTMIL